MARPQKFKEEDILNNLRDLFWKQGDVSIREIEAMLDLKATAIYRRFDNKDGVVAASITHYIQTIVEPRLRSILQAADDPIRGFREFFDLMVQPHANEAALRGCLLTNTAAIKPNDPNVRHALTRGFDAIETAFRRELHRGRRDGLISSEADPDILASVLFVALQGILSMARAGANDLEQRIDSTFDFLEKIIVP